MRRVAFLECDLYHEVGIKGFFNRLFGNKEKALKDTTIDKRKKVDDAEKEIRSFFKRLFKKN